MLDQGIISISQAIYYMIREPEPQLQPETDYKLRLFAVNNAIHIHTVRVVCKCKPNAIKLMLPYALCGDVPSRRAIFPYHRHRWSSVVGRCLAAILPIGKYSLILRPPSVSTSYIASETNTIRNGDISILHLPTPMPEPNPAWHRIEVSGWPHSIVIKTRVENGPIHSINHSSI